MKTLTIHIKRLNGTAMCPVGIHLMYLTPGEFPIRFIEHRGITDSFVARRPAMQDEIDECDHPYRIGFACTYNDWDKLIEDEKKFVTPEGWIDQLLALKVRYPQFKASDQLQMLLT